MRPGSRPRRPRRRSPGARSWGSWRACRSASRTCRRRPVCAPRGARCMYKDHVPTEDELGVANIRKAGGVVLGKTNTPEFGAGANTTQPRLRRNGQSVRSGRRPAAARQAARRRRWRWARCRSRPARTSAAACARRPASAAWPASGPRRACPVRRSRRLALALQRHGADGPLGGGHASAAARAGGARQARPVLLGRRRAHPGQADGRRSRAARVAVSADLGCAPVDKAIAEVFKARVALVRLQPSARCRSARPTSGRGARDVRDAALRAVRRRASRAPGEARASCSTATSSTTPSAA